MKNIVGFFLKENWTILSETTEWGSHFILFKSLAAILYSGPEGSFYLEPVAKLLKPRGVLFC